MDWASVLYLGVTGGLLAVFASSRTHLQPAQPQTPGRTEAPHAR